VRLAFLGAAGEVTGSCFLVETAKARFLVDCGLFQGDRTAEARNRSRFAFEPSSVDFVLLTHAHIDHSGLLPRLAAEGFRGSIFATAATCDLLGVMLIDSARIQEQESGRRRRAKAHQSARNMPPLYTVRDVERCLRQLVPVAYGEMFTPGSGVRSCLRDAGHILGSAIIEIWAGEGAARRKLVCSGDIGQRLRPLVRDPTAIAEGDVLLVESTYGNRTHRSWSATLDELRHAVTDTLVRKGGNVIVPSFAVGRTQDLLYLLADLYRKGELPEMDIYVDSPLALKATSVTLRHLALLDAEAVSLMRWLRRARGRPRIRFVQDVEESIALHRIKQGAVIISASGMCEAGRIQHHLRHNLGRPDCTIIIPGFQAAGTLGRSLVDGAKEVRIFGIKIPVRAEIYTIGGLSAHADREGLIDWLSRFERPPRATYVVHGEADISDEFANVVRDRLKWREVRVPQRGTSVELA
jgi:metallo-beta-lactamase family protein